MKKLATLFTQSIQEFRNVRTITVCAMFAAVSLILNMFTLTVGNYLKIGFSSIPGEVVYYLFGPAVGLVFGGVRDVLGYLVKPTGPFFPGFTVSAMLAGLLYGAILYKRPLSFKRVLAADLAVAVVCNMLFGTLWISMLYGKAFLVLLPARAIKNIIMWPIDSVIFYSVAKALEASGILRLFKSAYCKTGTQEKTGLL